MFELSKIIIESKHNEKIKKLTKLKNNVKYRREIKEYFVEGKKLSFEAIKYSKDNIFEIYVTDAFLKKNSFNELKDVLFERENNKKNRMEKIKIYQMNDDIYKTISNDSNPEGILVLLKIKNSDIYEEENIKEAKTDISSELSSIDILLDNIQDPGNVGTILRTATALSIKKVYFLEGVDIYNSKLIRASMGAYFKLDLIEIPSIDELKHILNVENFEANKNKEEKYKIFASDMNGKNIFDMQISEFFKQNSAKGRENKVLLVFGNEANGVRKEIKEIANKISIPMQKDVESLNVAIAASIIMYEIQRKIWKNN